jgi:tetratricopeptide (TPR) repeat protein
MRRYSGGHVHGGGTANARRVSIVATIIAIVWASVDSNALQGAVSINGTVSLPDGNPAIRVIVTISGLSGLNREVRTDSQGRFDFQGMPAGRYRLTATNPADPSQFTDAVEVDTSRSALNRLLVHLFLRTAQAKKEPRAGVLSLAEASQQIPKDARKAFEEALRLKADNKVEQALKIFTKAIDFYPSYFQALAERGQLHIAKNQNTEAIADFERAVKLNEQWGPALRGLGYCYLEQQKFEVAAKFLERAVATEPGVANTHLFFGIASLALDRRDAAKKALQEALRLDSKVAVTAHIYLADLYARERQFTEAADELRIYLAASPDAPNAARLKAKEAELRARTKR